VVDCWTCQRPLMVMKKKKKNGEWKMESVFEEEIKMVEFVLCGKEERKRERDVAKGGFKNIKTKEGTR